MRITRAASRRTERPATIEFVPTVSVDSTSAAIKLSARGIRDFKSDSRYDYVIEVSLSELLSILDTLAEDLPSNESGAAEEGVTAHLRSIIRLALVGVGAGDVLKP